MTATLSFRWLELLEKEFDKAFVDLDLLLGDIDPDQCELTFEGRQKMTALSAAFAQLCHKAQTVFQSNAKLEVSNIRRCTLNINYSFIIPVNLWELLRGDLPPTNSSKGEIVCVAFKRTKLYLVVAYM